MSSAVRAKPAVEYVAMVDGDIVGIVTTNGTDAPAAQQAAELIVAKQRRVSRGTVTVVPWDDCPHAVRVQAAETERIRWHCRALELQRAGR